MKPETTKKGYAACFDFSENKARHLCKVKYCRNKKAHNRRVCQRHHIAAWRMNHPVKASYQILKDHAKRRKLSFTLTLKQFTELTVKSGYLDNKGNTRYDLHLDRIDPLRGYEYDNLQIMTCSENSAKGATKDKSKYVAERLAKLKHLEKKTDNLDVKYSKPDDDDNCPF